MVDDSQKKRPVRRLLYSYSEAQEILGGLGRSKLFMLIANGTLVRVKIGRRSFLASAELERYVESLRGPDGDPPRHAHPEG